MHPRAHGLLYLYNSPLPTSILAIWMGEWKNGVLKYSL